MNRIESADCATRSLSVAARQRLLRVRGEPLFLAGWFRAVFIHYEADAETLQRETPFPLDLRDGKAYVSLVAFTMRGLRPRIGGRLGAWLFKPIATHEFLNVRTYVRHHGETGIYFLAEWLSNPLSVRLGPETFGLPYRFGQIVYEHEHGRFRGRVEARDGGSGLAYEGRWAGMETMPSRDFGPELDGTNRREREEKILQGLTSCNGPLNHPLTRPSATLPMNLKVGRVTPCAPFGRSASVGGAHGVTRPTSAAGFMGSMREKFRGILSPIGGDGRGEGARFMERGEKSTDATGRLPTRSCEPGSLTEFLMERYTAFTRRASASRLFRIWHEPWPQIAIEIKLLDDSLLTANWPWFRHARLIGANYSPGVPNVWMGRPHKLDCGETKRRRSISSAVFEMP